MQFSKRNLIAVALVFAVGMILFFSGVFSGNTFRTDGSYLQFATPEGSVQVAYTEIRSMEYFEAPDYGQPTDGGTKSHYMYGAWASETLGNYDAYIDTRIAGCILIGTDRGAIAVNMESAATTKSFYEYYGDYWRENYQD